MSAECHWGLVTTIKAPVLEILNFAAYHLDQGAARLYIFLDNDNPEAEAALAGHPKITTIRSDRRFLKDLAGFYPKKHQVRQTHNASYAYAQEDGLDWIGHIDVDEFLCPKTTLSESLARLPATMPGARVRPAEALCVEDATALEPETTYAKALPQEDQNAAKIERALYPNFGGAFKHGFISHTQGKIFLRKGLQDVKFAIHRGFEFQDRQIPDTRLDDVELCHKHVASWDKWLKIMQFRLEKGSYREDLGTGVNAATGRIAHNTLFTTLLDEGEQALRSYFEETCLAQPTLLQRLNQHNLLRQYKLDLAAKRRKHFGQ